MRTLRTGLCGVLAVAVGLMAGCLPGAEPTAVLSAATTYGEAPLAVGFDLSLSGAAASDAIRFVLDFGDGSVMMDGVDLQAPIEHVYATGGTYVARLVLTDEYGRRSEAYLPITVSQPPPTGLAVGMLAPDFEASTIYGESLLLSDTRGSVVLLDFWGAWCAPCRRSLPHLQQLYDTYGDDGLLVVLVSTDPTVVESRDYLEANGFGDLVCVWAAGGKLASPIVELYQMADQGIPRTFVLDRQGLIRYVGHPKHLSGEAIETLL